MPRIRLAYPDGRREVEAVTLRFTLLGVKHELGLHQSVDGWRLSCTTCGHRVLSLTAQSTEPPLAQAKAELTALIQKVGAAKFNQKLLRAQQL